MNADSKTRKLTAVAMMCAVSYLMVVVVRIPIAMFLSYEPKDVMITIGGFLFGPWIAMIITVIVCFIEMITISGTGFIGFFMNVLGSCCFACLAAYVYRRNHTMKGAAIGLTLGTVALTASMLLWNYLLTPIYLGYPREAVTAMLVPIFLPFNLFKGGVNMIITLLLYKPIVTALRKAGLAPPSSSTGSVKQKRLGISITIGVILVSCILLYLAMTVKPA